MLKLIQTNWGVFDLAFDANAKSDADIAFETLVYAALFTDVEADTMQSPDPYQRRGWWNDPSLGSLIWWLRQNPLSPEIRRATIENINAVLNSYPQLANIVVTEIAAPRSVSLLQVSISALYNGISVNSIIRPLSNPTAQQKWDGNLAWDSSINWDS